MSKFLFALLLAFTSFANAEEIMMVWAKKVDLYNKDGKIEKVLSSGQIVRVENFTKDASRYLINLNGKEYNARKSFFKSPAEVVVLYKKKILEYEAEVKKNDLKLSNIESDLMVRYVQALELRRDTALAYQTTSPYILNGGATSFVRSYASFLSEGKYKKLMKEWDKEVAKKEEEKKNIQLLKRKYSIAVEQLKNKIASFENLNDLLVTKNTKADTYFAIQDAQLYQNNKVVDYLKKGTSVLGRPHASYAGWYEVLVDKKKYVVKGTSIAKKSDYENQVREKMISNRVLISQLSHEVEIQQFQLKLYEGISRQLETDKFVQGGYGLVKNLIVPIDKDRNFTIKSPNADDVYTNTVKAAKVLREWKVQIASLSQASLKNQKNILALKKQMVDLEKDLIDFKNQ